MATAALGDSGGGGGGGGVLSLLKLPVELQAMIVQVCARHRPPRGKTLLRVQSASLINLSLVNKSLRRLCIPKLFSFVKVCDRFTGPGTVVLRQLENMEKSPDVLAAVRYDDRKQEVSAVERVRSC